MDSFKETYKLSITGEFADKNLEHEFFRDYMAKNIKYVRTITLALGILYMLFIIPDYLFAQGQTTILIILVNRLAFFSAILVFFFVTRKFENYKLLAHWITAYEILGSISFMIICGQYSEPNFLIQVLGVVILISIIFVTPNKLMNMLVASIFISVSFFAFSKLYIKGIEYSEFSAGLVYTLIILVISGFTAYKNNYYNRKQYMYGKELLYLSTTDWLTGINNRSKWDAELTRWIAYANRYGTPLSAVFFDVDDFKYINDVFGHLAGDQVIIEIAGIVRGVIRENDVFARWGGDEFMLLLPNTDQQQALSLTERLRTLVAEHQFGKVGNVTCSFGLASVYKDDCGERLVGRIDQLLYAAKLKGKNSVVK